MFNMRFTKWIFYFSKYKNANPITLLNELNKIFKNSEYDLVEVMENWIYVSGYPVLTVSLSEDKKSAIITQVSMIFFAAINEHMFIFYCKFVFSHLFMWNFE